MARVPTTTKTPVRRRDTGHVDPAMRPRAEDYQRFIHLVDCYRETGWDAARMYAEAPFRVADPATNAILLRAERDLLALAGRFGTPEQRRGTEDRIGRLEAGLATLWHPAAGLWTARDLNDGTPCGIGTSAGFLPLYARTGSPEQRAAAAATLTRWAGLVHRLVPSTDPGAAAFEPLRYWRGPVWAVVNWMIADGLDWAGESALAARVRDDTAMLIDAAGLMEYFDPTTGAGVGGADFSWTAAIRLLLAA